MSRSVIKGPFIDESLMKKVNAIIEGKKPKRPIKTWSRRSTVHPDFIGLTFQVHNGRKFIDVFITEDMVGCKLGEFSLTRNYSGHGEDKGKK